MAPKSTTSLALASPQARLLKVETAAAYMAVGLTTMKALIADGEIPTVHIGRSVRVDVQDMDDYIDRLKQLQQDPKAPRPRAPRTLRATRNR